MIINGDIKYKILEVLAIAEIIAIEYGHTKKFGKHYVALVIKQLNGEIMKKFRRRSMDKRLKDIYVIIGRIGTQSSVSLNLLQLSNEKSVNQQHLDNLEQIRFDAIAITITVFSLLITVVYNMLNISVQSLIKSILMILLFTIFILFLLVVIYYTVKINNEKKEKKQR